MNPHSHYKKWILNPSRLPIPPLRRGGIMVSEEFLHSRIADRTFGKIFDAVDEGFQVGLLFLI